MWLEIREPGTNKLLLRFDPERGILEVCRRGRVTLIDLTKYTACGKEPTKATESCSTTE